MDFSDSGKQIVIALAASMKRPLEEVIFTPRFLQMVAGLNAARSQPIREHDFMRAVLSMIDDGNFS